MQTSPRFRRVAALLAGLALVGCQTPTPPAPPSQSENNVAYTASATGKAGAPSNAPSLGAYANVIKSFGAVSDGNKVIRLSEDAFKRLPIGVELSGAEPRGTIVLPMEPVTPKSSRDRKLSGTVDYLGIEGTLVPEPYNFRARMGRNAGFIYGEGSWWNLSVYGRDVGCTAQADQVIGVYHYWWAAGSTGNWWLLSVDSYNSACPLSEFDPVAVGAGTPPSPRPTPTPTPDIIPPVIEEAAVSDIDTHILDPNDPKKREIIYTITVKATDENSGVKTKSLNVEFNNANFSKEGEPRKVSDNTFEFKAKFISDPDRSSELAFTPSISDNAGNTSSAASPQNFALNIDGDAMLASTEGTSDNGVASAYKSLLAVQPPAIDPDAPRILNYVFYSNSGLKVEVNTPATFYSPRFRSGSILMFIDDYAGNTQWAQPVSITPNQQKNYKITWDGKDWFGNTAQDGRYRIYFDDHAGWIKLSPKYDSLLRVTARACVKVEDWQGATISPSMSDIDSAHMLDRHLVRPHNIPSLKDGTIPAEPDDDMFSDHDSTEFSVLAIRPQVPYAKRKHDRPVMVPWSEEWEKESEKDKSKRYAVTRQLLDPSLYPEISDSYNKVRRIGGLVWAIGNPQILLDDSGTPNGRSSSIAKDAPVVMSEGAKRRIIFCRAVNYSGAPNSLNNAFPVLDEQKRFEAGL